MTIHVLVAQLRFTRSEFVRCLQGVSEADAVRQMLGHTGLPDFVGDMSAAAYHSEE